MSTRPQPRPLRGVSHGSPITGDLRALAAILIRLDQRPPLRVVTAPANQRSICQPHKT